MPVDLSISRHVIDAYMKGVQLRQEKEQQEEAAEIRRLQIEEARKQFLEKHELELKKALDNENLHKSTIALNQARIKDYGTRAKIAGLNALNNAKSITTPDGRRITLQDIIPDGFDGLQIEALTPQQQADLAVKTEGEKAQAKAVVEQPNRIALIHEQGKNQIANILTKANLDSVENEKDRKNRIEVAEINARRAFANRNATREERKAVIDEMVGAHENDILSGQTALEDLPKGDLGNAIQSRMKAQGTRLFLRKERDKFNEAPDLANFIDNVAALNKALKSYDFQTARDLRNSLEADLGLFARNTKAEKGNMSNQDIARMAELLPGWTYKNEENARRVKAIEEIYYTRMDQILRGTSPIQREAIKQRWGLRDRPVVNKSNNPNLSPEGIEWTEEK